MLGIINACENEWSTLSYGELTCNSLDEISVYNSIQSLKQEVDFILVILHGGHEMYSLPSPRMVRLYRWFVETGADAVIGHHTHVFSGFEIYRDKPIVYSVGNFIFDMKNQKNKDWHIGVCARLQLDTGNNCGLDLIPFRQFDCEEGIQLLEGEELKQWHEMATKKTDIIKNPKHLQHYFNDFIAGRVGLTDAIEPFSGNRVYASLRSRQLLPPLLGKHQYKLLANLVRCESHRDVLTSVLLNKLHINNENSNI